MDNDFGILERICVIYINLGFIYRWCLKLGDDIIKEVSVDRKEKSRDEFLRCFSIKILGIVW